jgi:cell division septation protein DedD
VVDQPRPRDRSVSDSAIGATLLEAVVEVRRRSRVDQQVNIDPPPAPEDARKATEEQRKLQEQLEHQGEDPDGPGLHQSPHDLPDESTR